MTKKISVKLETMEEYRIVEEYGNFYPQLKYNSAKDWFYIVKDDIREQRLWSMDLAECATLEEAKSVIDKRYNYSKLLYQPSTIHEYNPKDNE
jgi:hypothetical protein